MQIQKATSADCAALAQLCIQTFIQTYAVHNTEENLNHYLETNFNNAQLLNELENPAEAYFILFEEEAAMGYIKLNYNCPPDNFDSEATDWIEIQRIYVLEEYQKRGLGKYLLQIAVEEAQKRDTTYIWLGVWEKNQNAIQFYLKNGFSIIGTHEFVLGMDRQNDYLMRKIV